MLEQEKREQARNIGSSQVVDVNNPQNQQQQQQGLLSDQVIIIKFIIIKKNIYLIAFHCNRIMRNYVQMS